MDDEVDRKRARFAPLYLLREWLGINDEFGTSLHVSDGGHNDNLGITALIDRECDLIIALDATYDPARRYADLKRCLRMLDDEWLTASEEKWSSLAEEAPATGAVTFLLKRRNGEKVCRVVLAKSCLSTGTRQDTSVQSYARGVRQFPHETTSDQWFTADQMEAYVALGRALALDAVACLANAETPLLTGSAC